MTAKLSLIFIFYFVSASWALPLQGTGQADPSAPADSANNFGIRVYKELKKDPKFQNKNLFFSPLSIAIAMCMTHLGARGNTAREMERSFGWDPNTVHSDFQELGQALQPNSSDFILRLANRIWGKTGMAIIPSFVRDSANYYNAEMALADFANAHEQARQQINNWVENKTENKIRELMKPGMVSPSTQMVLVNAIYFKGTWMKTFDKKRTRPATFHVDNLQVPVKMMRRTSKEFRYFNDRRVAGGARVLELPYTGDETSMFVVLPNARSSQALYDLENQLTPSVIGRWAESVMERKVAVFLPKFKVGHFFEANNYLQNLGIRDLFTARADLSGITGSRGLSVSKVVHKAFVEVNEKGTEAAAASGVGVYGSSFPTFFRADHPFLYFLYHKTSAAILFMGRVMNPSQENIE